jgi:hypothetical protein
VFSFKNPKGRIKRERNRRNMCVFSLKNPKGRLQRERNRRKERKK